MQPRTLLITLLLLETAAATLAGCGTSTGPAAKGTYNVVGIINVGPPHVAAGDTVSLSSHGQTLLPLPLDAMGRASTQLDPGHYEAWLIVGGSPRAYDSNVVIRSGAITNDTLIVCPMCR